MRKFLISVIGAFVALGAIAAGDNTPTSKSYVDAAVAQKQDKISANIIMPAGYTRLEYLESTGTQWIDTGVVFNSGIGYELEYQPKTTNNFVVQAGTTGQVIAQGGDIWEFRFNGSINRRPSPSVIDLTQFVNIKYNIDHKCSVDNRIVYIGDLTLNAGGSIRLFGPNYRSSGRMSFFLIYDNGVLVNNLVPARRDSDNIVGMYDTMSNTFFTNSGTGEFVAGPVIGNQNQVLTNTGTAGEYGTKGIYDSTGEYATQTQNLVDAATMNAGVQNAIDSEFQCIEYDENNECLLLKLNSIITGKNLFNKNNPEMQINGYFNESTDYKITAYGGGDKVLLVKVLPNTTYTIQRLIPSSVYNRFRIGTFNTNRVPKAGDKATDILFSTYSLTIHDVTITTKNDTTYLGIFCRNSGPVGSDWQEFLDGFQVELGSHATSYEPYENIYIPSGE